MMDIRSEVDALKRLYALVLQKDAAASDLVPLFNLLCLSIFYHSNINQNLHFSSRVAG